MEFFRALTVQGNVISALTLRETRSRYGNSKLGFFWALFEPFAHIMVFIALFSALERAVPIGESVALFILTGIIPWQLFNNTVKNTMSAVKGNRALLGYPQVMPMDIIISRATLEFATLTIVMIFFISIITTTTGISIKIDSFLEMMKPICLIVLLALGLGMINAAIISVYPSFKSIYNAFSRLFYFMSGIFFTANFLSPEVFEMIDFNPMLHLIDWFRSGFYPNFNSNLYDLEYTLIVCVSFFFIGLYIERITSRKARIA